MDRRSFITAASSAAAITATGATAAPALRFPGEGDPLVGYWDAYQATADEFRSASSKPGNSDFDTPEMLEIDSRRGDLEKLLCDTPPISRRGAAAKLKFIENELADGIVWDQHPAMLASVIAMLDAA